MPVYIVHSSMPALHDGMARVAARISETTSAFSSSKNDVPPVFRRRRRRGLRLPSDAAFAVVRPWRAVPFERTRDGIIHAVRFDPVLPEDVFGDGWIERFEGIESADAHLVDDE